VRRKKKKTPNLHGEERDEERDEERMTMVYRVKTHLVGVVAVVAVVLVEKGSLLGCLRLRLVAETVCLEKVEVHKMEHEDVVQEDHTIAQNADREDEYLHDVIVVAIAIAIAIAMIVLLARLGVEEKKIRKAEG
jgi:hypothetical protein